MTDAAGRIEAARSALLARCDEHLHNVFAGHGTEPKRVRRAMQLARDLIAKEPAQADLDAWFAALKARFDAARVEMEKDTRDEDGWSLGGLRSIENEVDAARAQASARTGLDPVSARTLVQAAGAVAFIGLVVGSPAGAMAAYALAALLAVAPVVFGRGKPRLAAAIVLAIAALLLYSTYPQYRDEMAAYRAHAAARP